MSELEVLRAEYAGACYGVQRALDLTIRAADSGMRVCTLGPLIHNPRVVKSLSERGIGVADNVEDVEAIDAQGVVIRSHGVVPQVMQEVQARDLVLIDATCPHVLRAQRAAEQLAQEGRHVIVVGEAGHPEVEGISEHARKVSGSCTIICGVEEIPRDLPQRLGVVVQTTQSHEKLEAILSVLRLHSDDIEVKDTICFATIQRQKAAIDLAGRVDAMVIIGGRNSSNTTRLYEICVQQCERSFHIECVEEIDPLWFAGCKRVGISAGASTPDDQIDAVITYLENL